jgi:cardiolipin synthase
MWILAAVLATTLTLLIVLNVTSGEKKIEHPIETLYAVGEPQFVRSMGALLGPPIVDGNRVTALQNGSRIFPAMLDAIRSARSSITFETYIYWSGVIGEAFAESLAERARAGVRVHVLLDSVGAGKMESTLLEQLTGAGVEVEKYHPLRWYNLGRINNRTHRKLLVVDGQVGFTGGVGIADQWLGDAQDPNHWRDSHYRIVGPAVAQMQSAFMDNWIKTRGTVLHGEPYFPRLIPSGPQSGQMFRSSAGEGGESVRLMYLLSIANAQKSVRISASYFVPDGLSIDTLIAARKRGVTVDVVLPGAHIDAEVVRQASRARWGPLLEAGVRIYEFQPTMYHCKVMIVDDLWVSVGSTNFDNRSFSLNDEANLNILDAEFAREQARTFDADRERARQITYDMWQSRPRSEKVLDWVASLLRSQL